MNVCCNPAFGGTSFSPFTAASSTVTLRIFDDNSQPSGNDYGLDLISVTAVPEPATWGLMLGGFGLVGAAARRRSKAVVTYA